MKPGIPLLPSSRPTLSHYFRGFAVSRPMSQFPRRQIALLSWLLALLTPVGTVAGAPGDTEPRIHIGSKSFTESVILGEMLTCLAGHAGVEVQHRAELGGTQVIWKALTQGEIDAYVEYSGTLVEEIMQDEALDNIEAMRERLKGEGIGMTPPLGFNNAYALGMRRDRAEQLGIRTISDLVNQKDLKLGFSDEFMARGDGWPTLQARYKIPEFRVRGLDHALAYRGLFAGSIDVIDLYSTDPEIITYDLKILADDLQHFPKYEALVVYRRELEQTAPRVVELFHALAQKIDSPTMTRLNAASRVDRQPEPLIAAKFLQQHVDATIPTPPVQSRWQKIRHRLLINTVEHLLLVSVSLTAAIIVSIPLGIVAYRSPGWGRWILNTVGMIQTIPSMALLVFMIPILGLGPKPAIVALFLYSLLPIVRGTHTGLQSLSPQLIESALALGLPANARLRLIELPLASQSILAGIKTSAVINVGTATIGALIGAGGYGQPILTGIRLADLPLILQGAIPAALLAWAVQAGFTELERWLVPRGLRLTAAA